MQAYLNMHAGDAHYYEITATSLLTNHITGKSPNSHRDFTPVVMLYDAVKGDAGVATTYRRNVLGIGSSNHAPGDCRTGERDPRYLDRPANRGIYMAPGPAPLDVETWCDFAGPMYLLEPDDATSIFVQMTRTGDTGDVGLQQRRYDDLKSVRPV